MMPFERAAACFVVASIAMSCASPEATESCVVDEAENGNITIVCPDSNVTIKPCYADLADLDGSGEADEADCSLVGLGAFQRDLCDSVAAWKQLDACRATAQSNLHEGQVSSTEMMQFWRGQLVVGYLENFGMRLWRDADIDLAVDDAELSTVFASGAAFLDGSLETDGAGCLAASATDSASPVRQVRFWRDANCDGVVAAAEVTQLILVPPAETIYYQRLVPWLNGVAIVYFGADAAGTKFLRAWTDLDADYQVDTNEMLEIASGGTLRFFGSTVFQDSAGTRGATLRYAQNGVLFNGADTVWTFGNQWVQSAGTSSPALGWDAKCHAKHAVGGNSNIFVCQDADANVGVASGAATALSLVPGAQHATFLSTSGTVRDTSSEEFLALRARDHALLWVDANADDAISEEEVIRRDDAFDATFVSRAPLFLRTNGGMAVVERWFPKEETDFLGEVCNGGAPRCAGELECRVSGRAPDARCVPPAL